MEKIDKKAEEQQYTESRMAAVEELRTKVKSDKKVKIELQQSRMDKNNNEAYLKQVKNKLDVLFKAVDELREGSKVYSSRSIPS